MYGMMDLVNNTVMNTRNILRRRLEVFHHTKNDNCEERVVDYLIVVIICAQLILEQHGV